MKTHAERQYDGPGGGRRKTMRVNSVEHLSVSF